MNLFRKVTGMARPMEYQTAHMRKLFVRRLFSGMVRFPAAERKIVIELATPETLQPWIDEAEAVLVSVEVNHAG